MRLEGEVIGTAVLEVSQAVETALRSGQALTIDLAELLFVDREGVNLFRDLARRQVVFVNCSPFLNEQLKGAPNSGEQR
ncbi:MAG: hypothetical protein JST85_01560 [Acidobacteria bacterium]|nr:hypothetical protein [Acidobacteriota bacterium]